MDIVWKGKYTKQKILPSLKFVYEFFIGGKIPTQDSRRLKCAVVNLLFCGSQKPDCPISFPPKQIPYGALSHSASSGHLPYGLAV